MTESAEQRYRRKRNAVYEAGMRGRSLLNFSELLKDVYRLDGEPEKDWVRLSREARLELERDGRRIAVAPHRDNTGCDCRNVGSRTLVEDMFGHDCCGECNAAAEAYFKEHGE